MHPVLIDFGTVQIGGSRIPIFIGGYGLMFFAAILSGWLWFRYLGRQISKGVPWTDLYFVTVIAGFVGAKLPAVLGSLPDLLAHRASLVRAVRGGGVWLVGAIVGFFVFQAMARRFGLRLGLASNIVFVFLPFSHALGRVGCLLGGCCWGSPCTLPWAVTYTDPLAHRFNGTPLNVPLHPTVIYEAILEMANFGICYAVWRRKPPDWSLVVLWVGLYSTERFLLEFLRSDPRGSLGPLSASQWISLGLLVVAAGAAVKLWRGWRGVEPERPRTLGVR